MSAKAIVRLTLEVNVTDTWGDDCTVGQVKKQARHSAVRQISSLLNDGSQSIKLLKEPEFIQIVHTKI